MEKYKILTGEQYGNAYHDLYRSRNDGKTFELLTNIMSEQEVANHKLVGTPIEPNTYGTRYPNNVK